MDLKIEFRCADRSAVVQNLVLEMPGGMDAVAAWRESSSHIDKNTGVITQACWGVSFENRSEPSLEDLSRARVLNAAWCCGEGLQDAGISEVKIWACGNYKNIQVPMDLYSDRFPSEIPWEDLDRGARPMVRYLNNNGLPTVMSCSGHPGTSAKKFWVEFREDVTDQDVARFMEAHTRKNYWFCSNGMFCTRYDRPAGGGFKKCLQYVAADMLDAMLDLSDWVADDMSGEPGHGADYLENIPGQTAGRLCVENMDPATADALYRAVWKDHVKADIESWLKDNDEPDLTPEQADYAAERYVYDGKYDCNLSYWQNIGNVVDLARQFA